MPNQYDLKDLLAFTDSGIYCQQANVFIDPWKPVQNAIITHGHADHARYGHKRYLCHRLTDPIIKYRLGQDCKTQSVEYNDPLMINNVKFSFHPAGHIPGSSQIRVEFKGEIWVVTGDYKLDKDGFTTPFESVRCHKFITECTFGLPIYNWVEPEKVFQKINEWWLNNKEKGITSVIAGYSLGKAQRIINGLDPGIGLIYTHGAVENINEVLRLAGVKINPTVRVTQDIPGKDFTGNIIVAPPSALNSSWMNKFRPYSTALASGWMTLRGARRRRAVDRGFILSDHADWKGLNQAIELSGAERIICTHGYTSIFSKWLVEKGLIATTENTEYEGELSEINEFSEKESE